MFLLGKILHQECTSREAQPKVNACNDKKRRNARHHGSHKSLRNRLFSLLGALFITTAAPTAGAGDFDAEFSLDQHQSGGLYLNAEVATGVQAEFLLDTGASMVTVTEEVLDAAKSRGEAHHAGAIAARLANGRLQKMEVWELEHLRLGTCDVGPVEVAVVRKGRNILGLNALSRMAPFAIHLSPLKLAVSGCAPAGTSTPIAAAF